jgi:uncharacterized protein with HEPN domain
MSDRTDINYLKDMLEAGRRATTFSSGMEYETFLTDLKTQDAVVRNIEIIGEAAKNVSEKTRSEYPQIPWKQVAGMRDRLVHHYFGVNFDIVWDVVKIDIPRLIACLSVLDSVE